MSEKRLFVGHKVIYEQIFDKLLKLIPSLHIPENLPDTGRSVVPNYMNLSFDLISNNVGVITFALSQSYLQNGDRVPDPDMMIRVFPKYYMAEALTYQDSYKYEEVYPKVNFVDIKAKEELNQFLNNWLKNLINQGHKL